MTANQSQRDGVVDAGAPAGTPSGGNGTSSGGRAAVRGTDGWVEYPPVEALKVRQNGVRENMRDGDFIRSVRKGEVIAVIHPPTAGQPGETESGEPIAAEDGAPARIEIGNNVTATAEDPGKLLAGVDGHLALGPGGRLEVQTVVTVPGNLDLTVGNINFSGSIIVRGDVLADFTVTAGGSIEVHGNVEDSTLRAGGNVTVKNGFFGHGKGTIEAGGDVHVHHILNQCIIAGKDVYIEAEAVNATVRAGNTIIAPRAVIAGGCLDALHEVNVGVLGSEDGGQAKVRAGKRGRILERLGQLDKEFKHAEKQLTDVKAAVYKLVKMKVDGIGLSADQEQALTKLQEAQKLLPARLEALQAERVQLQAELQKKADARIEVHDTVHENVLIEINNVRKVVDSAIQGVIFAERGGTIEIQSR